MLSHPVLIMLESGKHRNQGDEATDIAREQICSVSSLRGRRRGGFRNPCWDVSRLREMASSRSAMSSLKLPTCYLLLPLALPTVLTVSAREPFALARTQTGENDIINEVASKRLQLMRVHGLLLWASMGLLMPVGLLVVRTSALVRCEKTVKKLFYAHVLLQAAAVFLAIAAAVLSAMNFENAFDNPHQRLGLALFAMMLLQPFVGFCRPHRGGRGRSAWYALHWLLGTGLCLLGIVTVYMGLYAYTERTLQSTRLWTVLFTAEVSVVGFFYLLQDRWDYMLKQVTIIGHNELVTPIDQLKAAPAAITTKM